MRSTRPRTLRLPPRLMRRGRRLGALSVVLLFVAGQLSGFYHAATVQHVRCAEHGELVDVGEAAAATVTSATVTVAHTALEADTAGARAEHGHEHCAAGPKRGADTQPTLRTSSVARLPASQPPPTTLDARDTAPRIALVLLAPKNSPPV